MHRLVEGFFHRLSFLFTPVEHMKTAIPSATKEAQNPAKSSHTWFSTPQSGRIAQLAAMINQSPCVQAQLKLAREIQNSDRVQKQMALAAEINHVQSPPTQPQLRKEEELVQREETPTPNRTGLPDQLKSGMESLSGLSLDDVKVHYNSAEPAQLNALAYAQGTDIHVARGQEKHLPHEAWHIVQQKQGRVRPTTQMKAGVPVNDDPHLENEATAKGQQALLLGSAGIEAPRAHLRTHAGSGAPVQRLTGFEVETMIPIYNNYHQGAAFVSEKHLEGWTDEIGHFLFGGLEYGGTYGLNLKGHFTITADHNALARPHKQLLYNLVLTGLLTPAAAFRSMTNLEYITPPRDETGKGNKDLFQGDIKELQQHATVTLDQAKQQKEQPVTETKDVCTGFPYAQILNWVTSNGADVELFKPILDEFQALIQPTLYIQKTTGVLPQDFSAFYESEGKKLQQGTGPGDQVMSELLIRSVEIAQSIFMTVKDDTFAKYSGAATGYLAYLASHLLADAVSQTSVLGPQSTSKNLLPFFPKVSLSTSFQALPEALRAPSAQTTWLALAHLLINAALPFTPEYWIKKYPPLGKRFPEAESEIFSEAPGSIESGKRPKTKEALETLFGGAEVHIGVEKNLPNLDTPHTLIESATGQKGIPVEDRYFAGKQATPTTIKNLEAVLNESYEESVSRNLSALQGQEQLELSQLAGTPLEEQEMALALTNDKYQKLRSLKTTVEEVSARLDVQQKSSEAVVLKTKEAIQKLTLKLEELSNQLVDLNSRKKKEALVTVASSLPQSSSGVNPEVALNPDSSDSETQKLQEEIELADLDLELEKGSLTQTMKEMDEDQNRIVGLKDLNEKLAISISSLAPTFSKSLWDLNQTLHETLLTGHGAFHQITHTLRPQIDAIGEAREGLEKLLRVKETATMVAMTFKAVKAKGETEHNKIKMEPEYYGMISTFSQLKQNGEKLGQLLGGENLKPAELSGILKSYTENAKRAFEKALAAYKMYAKTVT